LANAQSGPTIADVVFPEQLNHRGTLFGGAAIALMDRAAFVAASREATAVVERRGRRSMTVSVVVVAETLATGERREAVRGSFHMVTVASPTSPAPQGAPA
jgi:acyl-CoA hydrolase